MYFILANSSARQSSGVHISKKLCGRGLGLLMLGNNSYMLFNGTCMHVVYLTAAAASCDSAYQYCFRFCSSRTAHSFCSGFLNPTRKKNNIEILVSETRRNLASETRLRRSTVPNRTSGHPPERGFYILPSCNRNGHVVAPENLPCSASTICFFSLLRIFWCPGFR